jgi:hypothetical protein
MKAEIAGESGEVERNKSGIACKCLMLFGLMKIEIPLWRGRKLSFVSVN